MNEFGSAGLSMGSKQYGIKMPKQQEQPQKAGDAGEGVSRNDENFQKGMVANEDIVHLTGTGADAKSITTQELDMMRKPAVPQETSRNLGSLKDQYRKALTDQMDNAQNWGTETFYKVKSGAINTAMNLLGVNPQEVAQIKKEVRQEAMSKVEKAFGSLMRSKAEFKTYT